MLRHFQFSFVIAAFLLFFPLAAVAQLAGNPENWCRGGHFPQETNDFKLAKVVARNSERVYFYKDDPEDCPGGANCRAKAYLVAGDEVIVSRTFGQFVCAWYESKKEYETVGWIKTADLQISEPNANPKLDEWVGAWSDGSSSLDISRAKSVLDVTGSAFWRGLGDNVHTGEIGASGTPQNNRLELSEGEDTYNCRATLRLIGKYLVVSDNMQCGGVNVTFTGVYQKETASGKAGLKTKK